MNVTLTLTDAQIDVIAARAAEIVIESLADDRSATATEYLSVTDAATYLGCTEGRLRKLIEQRRIPFTQDGRGCRVFLSKADLDQFMHDNRNDRRT